MKGMIIASLVINIGVLIPVCAGLLTDAFWARKGYGEASHARQILLAVYISIAIASGLLLYLQDPKFVAVLLFMQIVYKLITPVTVGTVRHPVVVSNIAIALFHSATLWVIWDAFQRVMV